MSDSDDSSDDEFMARLRQSVVTGNSVEAESKASALGIPTKAPATATATAKNKSTSNHGNDTESTETLFDAKFTARIADRLNAVLETQIEYDDETKSTGATADVDEAEEDGYTSFLLVSGGKRRKVDVDATEDGLKHEVLHQAVEDMRALRHVEVVEDPVRVRRLQASVVEAVDIGMRKAHLGSAKWFLDAVDQKRSVRCTNEACKGFDLYLADQYRGIVKCRHCHSIRPPPSPVQP
eukprot:Clim_evm10s53 gene=Clim_evmTU10s53